MKHHVSCGVPFLKVLFIGINWFFISYLIGHIILFIAFDQGGGLGEFIKQVLFINVTFQPVQLLLAYASLVTIVSIIALIIFHSQAARTMILVGGTIMGVFLGIFAYFMTLYFSNQPCISVGCPELEFNSFLVLIIYLVYGVFITPQIPLSWALRSNCSEARVFGLATIIPGLISSIFFFLIGLFITLRIG